MILLIFSIFHSGSVFGGQVHENTALLYVPYGDEIDNFVFRFNSQTGSVNLMESMRYRDPGKGNHKILWITRNEGNEIVHGTRINRCGSATWLDQGKPWAYFTIEDMKYNVDTSENIKQRGYEERQ